MTDHLNSKIESFSDFALSENLLKAIDDVGYEKPSAIQSLAIPHLLSGEDILGVAQTGTGKTAAFAIPMLEKIDPTKNITQGLVLAPTRELAIQVAQAIQTYSKHMPGVRVLPIYGGQDYKIQLKQLDIGPQIVVGTPGRVIDHLNRGTLKISQLRMLVLDEADEMLKMGFIDDVERILQDTPESKQTALFSATMPNEIKRLTKQYLRNPVDVAIPVKTSTAETITQQYWNLRPEDKIPVLLRILETGLHDGVIIFVRTKNDTLDVADRLMAKGFSAAALNGDILQKQREKIVSQIKKRQIDIIVATDVAARGLDVDRLTHVINYDMPYDTESYVHRIGRTGRAGREGVAILFVTPRESRMLSIIERATKQKMTKYQLPTVDEVNAKRTEQFFEKITEALGHDLEPYTGIVKRFAQERNIGMTELAAALAYLSQGGQPLLLSADAFAVADVSHNAPESRDRSHKGRKSSVRSYGKNRDFSGSYNREGGGKSSGAISRSRRPDAGAFLSDQRQTKVDFIDKKPKKRPFESSSPQGQRGERTDGATLRSRSRT